MANGILRMKAESESILISAGVNKLLRASALSIYILSAYVCWSQFSPHKVTT